MRKVFKVLFLVICISGVQNLFGQTKQEQAEEKGKVAVSLEDEGKFDDAIKLLNEAKELDPESLVYPYELAYSYYSQKDYKKAISYLEPLTKHKDVIDRVFQLLGNSYDDDGNSEKALQVYDDGLKIFPSSGKLYLEKGNVYWVKKDYGKALPFYEQGIKVDPAFPSNYFRAAKLYCNSTEEIWGMIYGELFMNLERNTARTKEISELLYNTYKSQIKFTSDTSSTVSFSKNNIIDANELTLKGKLKLPFSVIYEPSMAFAIASEKSIDINSLDRIRGRFIDFYDERGFDKTYPNVLFEYQKRIKDLGHMEAYNHWILMMGDEPSFKIWQSANSDKWNSFIKWFADNPLKLDSEHNFFREQY
jgi:tetratricopeptide (TPR) repeat protein